jgi:hypothetical protein
VPLALRVLDGVQYMSSDLLMYRIFVSIFNRIFYYVLQLCVACALWDWRKCMVPILKVRSTDASPQELDGHAHAHTLRRGRARSCRT